MRRNLRYLLPSRSPLQYRYRDRPAGATDVVDQSPLDPFDLPHRLLDGAPELVEHLVRLPCARRSDRVALRLQAAARVDRLVASDLRVALLDELARLALLAEPEVLVREKGKAGQF